MLQNTAPLWISSRSAAYRCDFFYFILFFLNKQDLQRLYIHACTDITSLRNEV
uniref:Uncharacterized protein n=1 Tax=Anguilla anguilla TaxID=7936 RepID=A0A0E9X0H2_ANGAN